MDSLLHIFEQHGYLALLVIVFLEAIGLPVPAAIALVVAGAAAALHKLSPSGVIAIAALGILTGDMILYEFGRHSGWRLLNILCRVAVNPEACVVRSAESFHKRGRLTLLFAKFIPGINTMAPPLAGSMRMRVPQFLMLDLGGTLLYVLTFSTIGFLFSHLLKDVLRLFQNFGHMMEFVLAAAVIGYIAYRAYLYWTHRVYRVVPRTQVTELVARREAGEDFLIADVRSTGYYDPGTKRIPGSIHIEPANLDQSLNVLPKDKLIFLYCT